MLGSVIGEMPIAVRFVFEDNANWSEIFSFMFQVVNFPQPTVMTARYPKSSHRPAAAEVSQRLPTQEPDDFCDKL